MIMSLIAAALAAPAATYPAQPITARDQKCPDAPTAFHATAPDKPNARRLDREPPASTYLTLFRSIDRCATPIVVQGPRGR